MQKLTRILDRVFFLEMGVPEGKKSETLAVGLVILKPENELDKNVWGYLSFHDQIAGRQRAITLQSKPEISETKIKAVSDIGENFNFAFVTKEVWEEKVKKLFQVPVEVEDKLIDTEQVQSLLLNLYP